MSENTELKVMDEQLESAARNGDIQFLRKELTTSQSNNDHSSFLSVVTNSKSGRNGNIFHLAAWDERDEFFEEAMQGLPRDVVQDLLTQHEPSIGKRIPNSNPLHVAASQGHLGIVKLILGFYKSLAPHNNNHASEDPDPDPLRNIRKPWLGQEIHGSTPLHIALEMAMEECALELLSFDMESLVKLNDHRGKSVLYVAVKYGCSKVAKEILTCVHPYSITGNKDQTPLHFAPKCSDKEVCKLLVQKHPQLINAINMKGYTVLHQWLKIGEFWPFEYLIKNDDIALDSKRDLIGLIDHSSTPSKQKKKKNDDASPRIDKTPLLDAFDRGNVEAISDLVDAYKQGRAIHASINSLQDSLPWLRRNKDGKTLLDLAILENKEEIALCFLSPEINSVLQGLDNPLFLAIEKKCYTVAKGILDIQTQHGWSVGLSLDRGRNILHGATNYKEEVGTWLVEQFPTLVSEKDDDEKTPLHVASEAGLAWLVEVMLIYNPSSLDTNPLAWVEACEKGHISTVLAFINHCPDLRDVCLEHRDTPLHHINLRGYTAYKEFLKTPIFDELKYTQDTDGATPLHRAIMNKNISLAEALLTKNWIDWRIKNNSDETAMDLLAAECIEDLKWDEMCKRVGINPKLKMTYVQQETNLLDMRATLSVVAALLATITFTAGFTLPGGTDKGEAILAKKAAFLVFLVADTYAMCCSMLVLFCLMWSMVCERNGSLLLIDRSMVVLLQSLYGTLVAFMTGVFTVIFHNSLWAAILIFVMCGLVAISATIRITLYKLLDKIIPAANEHWIQNLFVKLGNAGKCWGRNSSQNTIDPLSNV